MKIIVLGAGQVGLSMAEILSREDNDVTLVDTSQHDLQQARDRLDIQTVQGNASHPEVLARANAEDADLIVAVTNSDETNMVACQIAHTLFHTPKKIARLRTPGYLAHNEIFKDDAVPVDVIISPEQLITGNIRRLIKHPGALQVLNFAGGRIQLVAVRAYHGGPLVGHELREFKEHMPAIETRVAAVYRKGSAIIPKGNTVIESDDEVFFIAADHDISRVMSELRVVGNHTGRNITLAGAGNIGLQLARDLETDGYNVKLIEKDTARATAVSEWLDRAVVLHGDASDEELMRQENIENAEVFCALTNSDEANIMSSILARDLGARRIITLVNRPAYMDIVERRMSDIVDIVISPRMATVGSLLAHVRRGDVVAVHSLRRGAAEAIEAVVHGTAGVVGRRVDEIALPAGATIGAMLRGEEVVIAHDNTVIEAEDHVILFVVDKKHIPEIERLFQVDVTFV